MRIEHGTDLEPLKKPRKRLRGEPTETEFQSQVVELFCDIYGWRHLHVRRSRGKGGAWTTATNWDGWPDLALFHPPAGIVFAELKVSTGLSDEQADTLRYLRRLDGARCFVWTPADFEAEIRVIAAARGGRMHISQPMPMGAAGWQGPR